MTDQPTDDERAGEGPAGNGGRTGFPAADQARDRLDELDDADLERHVEIYEDAHRRLQEGLADLDEG